MGSSSSYSSYNSAFESTRAIVSEDEGERESARRARSVRLEAAREAVVRGEVVKGAPMVEKRRIEEVFDSSSIRSSIGPVPARAKRAVVVLVDNSGSNATIAKGMREASGYLTAVLRTIDPDAAVSFVYFSDLCDGRDLMIQEADWVFGDPTGDRQLASTLSRVRGASGGDLPEAVSEALVRAAELDFAAVARENRTVILVTDAVPHGMEGWSEATGEHDDHPRPQLTWRTAMRKVREAFGRFVLIGSGDAPITAGFQRKLFETAPGVEDTAEVAENFIDLSGIPSAAHRNGIVTTAVLFVIARDRGIQALTAFLATLYEKWITSTVFGKDSDRLARERIRSFGLYLRSMYSAEQIERLFADVIPE